MPNDSATVDTSEFNRLLGEIGKRAGDRANQLLRDAALAIEARARELAPVDTGILRASMGSAWHGGQQAPPATVSGTTQDRRGPDGKVIRKGGKEVTVEVPRFPLDPKPGEAYIYNTVGYAAAVHEDLEAHHYEGEAKFLEKAITGEGTDILANLAANILKGA